MNSQSRMYDVGGVLLARPFKARRLGHFALWQTDLETGAPASMSTCSDFVTPTRWSATAIRWRCSPRMGPITIRSPPFTHRPPRASARRTTRTAWSSTRISFQVGTLEEVANAHEYFAQRQVTISRLGRDFPGSNWALYVLDPDGHRIEFYYGMEQIGWDRRSKPAAAYLREVRNGFTLPQPAEMTEIMTCERSGIDLDSGFRPAEDLPYDYCVGGVMLQRPFKVTRIGPVKLFVSDIDASERFYTELLGLTKTEDVDYRGHRCVFLRCGAEHHSIGLFPMALRQEFGLDAADTLMSIGDAGRDLPPVAGCDRLPQADRDCASSSASRSSFTPASTTRPTPSDPTDIVSSSITRWSRSDGTADRGRRRSAAVSIRIGRRRSTLRADTYADQTLQGPLG